jgi:hypothetical protein
VLFYVPKHSFNLSPEKYLFYLSVKYFVSGADFSSHFYFKGADILRGGGIGTGGRDFSEQDGF